ncbi:hypothetical protein ACT4MK_01505 (plasmid) [Bradyrhizobium barranii]|uniref:hypothetical protein n=1 Tax=Bradyrhizobium TaxID=374 RepID=UPI003F246C28
MNQVYLDSARLLTRVAPLVLVDDTFALKGGTAINLFVRDGARGPVSIAAGSPPGVRAQFRGHDHRAR